MAIKIETRGRKALSPEDRKAPQATVKINEFILPFVKELKGNLKKGNVTNKTIERLFNVLNNNWKQTDALTEEINLKNEVKRLKDELLAVNQTLATKSLDADERLKLKDRYN